jgi:hypothetical protein
VQAAHDVALGDDADEPAAVDHGQGTDVASGQLREELDDARAGRDRRDVRALPP